MDSAPGSWHHVTEGVDSQRPLVVARLAHSNTSRPCPFILQLSFFPSGPCSSGLLSRLYQTYNEGPGEGACPKFTDSTLPSLTCFRHESITVPVEDQCKLVFGGLIRAQLSHHIRHLPFCPVLQSYLCASFTARPFVFLGLLPFLDLLFFTPDISALGSFYPKVVKSYNLSTWSVFAS